MPWFRGTSGGKIHLQVVISPFGKDNEIIRNYGLGSFFNEPLMVTTVDRNLNRYLRDGRAIMP